MNWALNQELGAPATKLVLLILANRANQDGICWPGFGGMSQQTELSRRSVITHIRKLVDLGMVTVEHRSRPLTNIYQLNLKASAGAALVQELHGAGAAPGSAGAAPPVVQELHLGSAGAAPEPSITINKPKVTQNSGRRPTLRFEEFWSAYPIKRKRKTALDIWQRKRLDLKADELIADVRTRKAQDGQWLDGFIPDPTTYLNGARWQDELAPRKAPSKPQRKPTYAESLAADMSAKGMV